jgi:hypothetical protein
VRFSETVRVLAAASGAADLVVPAFVTPPHTRGSDRVVRRLPRGEFSIGVTLEGRPFAAVQADLIEGIVLVNGLAGVDAAAARRTLWAALASSGQLEEGGVVVAFDADRRRRRAANDSPTRRSA